MWQGCLTVITREVLNGHILDGDFFEEVWFLTSRISGYNSLLSEPFSQPSQVAITVKGIGQEISKRHMQTMQSWVHGFTFLLFEAPCYHFSTPFLRQWLPLILCIPHQQPIYLSINPTLDFYPLLKTAPSSAFQYPCTHFPYPKAKTLKISKIWFQYLQAPILGPLYC